MRGICFLLISSTVFAPTVLATELGIDPLVEKLFFGSAQVVLAIVAIVMFRAWRADGKEDKKERKEREEILQATIVKNAESNALLSKSNDQLKESIYHFSKIIEKCKGHVS